MNETIEALINLSHEIGREDRGWAILGEGNTSTRLEPGRFAVKASGCSLRTLAEDDITVCDSAQVLALLEKKSLRDAEIDESLMNARVDAKGRKPSVESMFHAWLLQLEGDPICRACALADGESDSLLAASQGFRRTAYVPGRNRLLRGSLRFRALR